MIKISTQFDAGSVVVKDLTDPANIRLALRPDNASDFAPMVLLPPARCGVSELRDAL